MKIACDEDRILLTSGIPAITVSLLRGSLLHGGSVWFSLFYQYHYVVLLIVYLSNRCTY